MLLRIGKRRESFANYDLKEIVEVEFTHNGQADLALSAYEVPDLQESVVRAHAEHVASLDQEPRGRNHVNLAGIVEQPEETPGEGRFLFTNRAHRELRFNSQEDLESALARIISDFMGRMRATQKSEVKGYCRQRLDAQDHEWVEFLRESKNATAWR